MAQVVDRRADQEIVHAVASQGARAERYGHSFNRNKAVIWRMSVHTTSLTPWRPR